MLKRSRFLTLVLLAVSLPMSAGAVPGQINIQGVLRNGSGALQTMMVPVSVAFYDKQSGGTLVANTPTPVTVMATNGLFTVPMIFTQAQRDAINAAPQLWMQITAGSDTFPPQLVGSDIYALFAGSATVAGTADSLSAACSGCVTGAKIASATITSGNIASGTIQRGNIMTGALNHGHSFSVVARSGMGGGTFPSNGFNIFCNANEYAMGAFCDPASISGGSLTNMFPKTGPAGASGQSGPGPGGGVLFFTTGPNITCYVYCMSISTSDSLP